MMIEDWEMEEENGPSFAVFPSIDEEFKFNSQLTAMCFLNADSGIHHLSVSYSAEGLNFIRIELILNNYADHFSKGRGFNIQPISLENESQRTLENAFENIQRIENQPKQLQQQLQPQQIQLIERLSIIDQISSNSKISNNNTTNFSSAISNEDSSKINSICSSKSTSPYFPQSKQSFICTIIFNSTILMISFDISPNSNIISSLRTETLRFPGNINQVFLNHSLNQLLVSYSTSQDNSTSIIIKEFFLPSNQLKSNHDGNNDASASERLICRFYNSTETVVPEGIGITNDFSIIRVITNRTNSNSNHLHRFYLNTFHISSSQITSTHKPLSSLLSESTKTTQHNRYSVLFSLSSNYLTISDGINMEVHDFNNLSVKNIIKESSKSLQGFPQSKSQNHYSNQQQQSYSSLKFITNLNKSTLLVANSSNSAIALYHLDNPISILELIPIPNLSLPSPIPTKMQPLSMDILSPMNISLPSPCQSFPMTPKHSAQTPVLQLSQLSSPLNNNQNPFRTPHRNQGNSLNSMNPSSPLSTFSSLIKDLVISVSPHRINSNNSPNSVDNLIETYEAFKLSSTISHIVLALVFLVDGRIIPILIDQDSLDIKLPELKQISSQITSYNNGNCNNLNNYLSNPDDSQTFLSDIEASNHRFSKSSFQFFKTPENKPSFNFHLSSLENSKGVFTLDANSSTNRSSIFHHKAVKQTKIDKNKIQSIEDNTKLPQPLSHDHSLSFEIDSISLLKELHGQNIHENRVLFTGANHNSLITEHKIKSSVINNQNPMISFTRENSFSLGNGSDDKTMEEESDVFQSINEKPFKNDCAFINNHRFTNPSQFNPLRAMKQLSDDDLVNCKDPREKQNKQNTGIQKQNLTESLSDLINITANNKRCTTTTTNIHLLKQVYFSQVSHQDNSMDTFQNQTNRDHIQKQIFHSPSALHEHQILLNNDNNQEFSFEENDCEDIQRNKTTSLFDRLPRSKKQQIRQIQPIINIDPHFHHSYHHNFAVDHKENSNVMLEVDNNDDEDHNQGQFISRNVSFMNSHHNHISTLSNPKNQLPEKYPCFFRRNNHHPNNINYYSPSKTTQQSSELSQSRSPTKSISPLNKSMSLHSAKSNSPNSATLRTYSPSQQILRKSMFNFSLHLIELENQPPLEPLKDLVCNTNIHRNNILDAQLLTKRKVTVLNPSTSYSSSQPRKLLHTS